MLMRLCTRVPAFGQNEAMNTQPAAMPAIPAPDHRVDARQLYCPEPVMLLHKAVREVEDGQLIELLATDPSTERDVPKFCHFLGHELLEHRQDGELFRYLIRKQAKRD
jgi:tRNA 2-thiouridine synthesizing protein A